MKRGDRVYTPDWAAQDMVEWFRPAGRVLEPFRGQGAIYQYLPPGSDWCEIDEGQDFFDWQQPVDWIVSNPPYSQLRPVARHSFLLAANVVYLIPLRNFWSGFGFIREAYDYGGIVGIRVYGTGGSLGFPMGNAVGAVHWQRGYRGEIEMSFTSKAAEKPK